MTAPPAAPEGRTLPSIVDHITRWSRLTTGAFALIAIALIALLVQIEGTYAPRVRDAVESARVVRTSHEAMLEQESALRAFLLSGDEQFLSPYRRAAHELTGLT